MKDFALKDLLEAGCHFGHQKNRWNPKAAPFIYGVREGVHIIDLFKTKEGLLKAAEFLVDLARNNGTVLFVGTKRQATRVVADAVAKIQSSKLQTSNFYYLLDRWPGGLLTNFDIIKKNNLDTILKLKEDIAVEKAFATKKEKLLAQRKLDKYLKVYGGLVGLSKIPDAVFFVDVKKDSTAVREAKRVGAKVVAIVDTNTDPTLVDYAIPANDDAVGSIKIIIDFLTDAWIEGLQLRAKTEVEAIEETKEEVKPEKKKVKREKTNVVRK